MAKQRPQVGPISAPPTLVPQAHGVSTYHDPINGGGPAPSNALIELARGLSAVHPGMAALMDRHVQEEAVAGAGARDLAAAREANQKQLGMAVKEGKIPAGASPWYKKAWEQQDAEIRGHAFKNALETWYSQDDVKNIDDPAKFDQQVQEFTAGYLDQQGLMGHPELDTVLAPMIQQSQANLAAAHTQYRIQETEKKVAEGADTLSRQTISDGIRSGEDPKDTALTLQAIANRNIMNGMSGTVANQIAANAIINEAKNNLSLKTLDLLDEYDTGNGKLGKVGYVKDLRADAEAYIARASLHKMQMDNAAAEQQQREQAEKLHSDFITASETDPNFNIEDWALSAAAVDPKLAATFRTYRRAQLEDQVAVHEDPAVLAGLYARANDPQNPLTPQELVEAAANKQIGVVSVGQLNQEIQRAKNRSPLDDDTMRYYRNATGEVISGSSFQRTPETARLAAQGEFRFQRDYSQWLEANPKASFTEKRDMAEALHNEIVKQLSNKHKPTTDFAGPTSKAEAPKADAPAANGDEPVMAPTAALAAPKGSIDLASTLVYDSPEALDAAIMKFKASGGKDGSLVRIAQQHGQDPVAFIEYQKALLKKRLKASTSQPNKK